MGYLFKAKDRWPEQFNTFVDGWQSRRSYSQHQVLTLIRILTATTVLLAAHCKRADKPAEKATGANVHVPEEPGMPSFTIKPVATGRRVANKCTDHISKLRLVWHSKQTLAWVQEEGSNIRIHYGNNDYGTDFQSYPESFTPQRSLSYKGMTHYFYDFPANLHPGTAYYLVISHSLGNSCRFWFKTPPPGGGAFTFIAGGDSRSNRYMRRKANKMVARLRPLFVAFGGDFTIFGFGYQWQRWLDDWQLTTGSDRRLIPIVPARGNHERSGTVSKVFGVDKREYHYFRVNDLLSVYTLNSEVSISGTQKHWLNERVLADNTKYKIAQYHRPVRPHVASKSPAQIIYEQWVPIFERGRFAAVFESDSHSVKATWPVIRDSGPGSFEGFARNDSRGIVYLGEGIWGAPLRPANAVKPWTRDSGSFNQFKWMKVTSQNIQVRTVLYENADRVSTVSDQTSYTAPAGLRLFHGRNSQPFFIGQEPGFRITIVQPVEGQSIAPLRDFDFKLKVSNSLQVKKVKLFANGDAVLQLNNTLRARGRTGKKGRVLLTARAFDKSGRLLGEAYRTIWSGPKIQYYKINHREDDAEENYQGRMTLYSSDLEMVEDVGIFGGRNQVIGLRFRNIQISQGARIKTAYIQFTSQDIDDEKTRLVIAADAASRVVPISSSKYNLTRRKLTASRVQWYVKPWYFIEDSTDAQRTPNLHQVIEEVVQQPQWQKGNDIVFIIKGEGEREAFTYDQSKQYAPFLMVEPL